MSAPVPAYVYNATVLRWVDGDTVDLDIDLGFHVHTNSRCRLLGIDTPERGRTNWAEASAYAKKAAPAGTGVVIESQLSADKYGRLLVTVHVGDRIINQSLIDAGLAVSYGGGHKPDS